MQKGKNNIVESMKEHIKKRKVYYIISICCIVVGVIIGVNSVNQLEYSNNTSISNIFENSIAISNDTSKDYEEIIINGVQNYLPMVILLWLSGLTIIGIPFILLIDIYKGYTLGFTTYFLIKTYVANQLWGIVLQIIIKNIIIIPCILILSVLAMNFSLRIIKSNNLTNDRSNVFTGLVSYSMVFILCFLLIGIGSLIDSAIAPVAVKTFVSGI